MQYDASEGWVDVEGGNSLILSLVANKHNVEYKWRVVVTSTIT